jgi:FMN reductase
MTAGRTYTVAVVTAGLSDPSSTRLLADRLAAATEVELGAQDVLVEVVELRELAHDLANNMLTGFAAGPLAQALETVARADAVIAVTPVFSASYSGLFKMFFDVVEEGSLAGTPVLIAATAGTARHSLVLEYALRPLFSYLKAVVVPTAVFAASEDWGHSETSRGPALSARIERAARELAALVVARPASAPGDPFQDPTPFEQLLGGGGLPSR